MDRNCNGGVSGRIGGCRPLTGAWIETMFRQCVGCNIAESPPHRGVDRNHSDHLRSANACRRPLTGAWIETHRTRRAGHPRRVAPSQGRGSKHPRPAPPCGTPRRPLTGAWIETLQQIVQRQGLARRPLTGAWIETTAWGQPSAGATVAPSQGRGSKRDHRRRIDRDRRRPLTGAWIETPSRYRL